MKPVEYHPSALEELIQAAEYYESKVDGLGQRFLDEIEICVADISVSPDRWPYLILNARRRLLDRFPYMLVYLDEADRITHPKEMQNINQLKTRKHLSILSASPT